MKLFAFIVLLLFTACASRKYKSEETLITSLENVRSKSDSLISSRNDHVFQKEVVFKNYKIKKTETFFSEPDSTGKQHVVSTVQTETDYTGNSRTETEVFSQEQIKSGSNIRDSTYTETEYSKTEEKKVNPVWISWVLWSLVLAGSGYLIYYFFIRKLWK